VAGHGQKQTQREEAFIAALLTQLSIPAACKQAGISERSGYRWLAEAGFQRRYAAARQRVLTQTIGLLVQSGSLAVLTLRKIMLSDEATSSARVAAARTILELSVRLEELITLEQRVAELEQRMKEGH
jgi:hypothetical protein